MRRERRGTGAQLYAPNLSTRPTADGSSITAPAWVGKAPTQSHWQRNHLGTQIDNNSCITVLHSPRKQRYAAVHWFTLENRRGHDGHVNEERTTMPSLVSAF